MPVEPKAVCAEVLVAKQMAMEIACQGRCSAEQVWCHCIGLPVHGLGEMSLHQLLQSYKQFEFLLVTVVDTVLLSQPRKSQITDHKF